MSEKSTYNVCEVKTCLDNYQPCLDMGAKELKWHVLWWIFSIKRLTRSHTIKIVLLSFFL